MKKCIKLIAAIMACVLICCGGSVFAMNAHTNTTEKVDEGECNTSGMIIWKISKNVINGLREYYLNLDVKDDPQFSDPSHPEYRQTDDYNPSGSQSDAEWVGVVDNEGNDVTIDFIEIANGIEKIGANAFRGQSDVKTVTIYPSLKEIGESAFEGCTGIQTIKYYGTEAQWKALIIGDNNEVFGAKTYEELVDEGILSDVYAVKGDVDLDGDVDKDDALAVAGYVAKNNDGTELKLSAADVNGDGVIDVCDCVKIMNFVNNQITVL